MRFCLRHCLRLLAAGLVLGGLVACQPAEPVATEGVRPVRTQVLQPQAIELVGAFPGEVRPQVESPLGFRVAGKVIERAVQRGDTVQAGQLLARLDPHDLQLAEAAARAQLTAAEVEYSRVRGDLQRFTRLRQSGFISSAEFDARQAAYEGAQAAVAQARANLAARRNQTAYAELRADAAGVVTATDAEVGQVVAAGQAVVRLARSGHKEVAFQVPEGLVETVRRIQAAQVDLWSGPSGLPARLTEVAASADPATRAFPARVSLKDTPDGVHFGMSATVRFQELLTEPLVAVPLAALWREGEATQVWLYDPAAQVVRAAPARVVTVTDTRALLRADFPEQAEVVTAGVHRLREGMAVRRLAADPAPQALRIDGAMLPLGQPQPGAAGLAAASAPPVSLPAAAPAAR